MSSEGFRGESTFSTFLAFRGHCIPWTVAPFLCLQSQKCQTEFSLCYHFFVCPLWPLPDWPTGPHQVISFDLFFCISVGVTDRRWEGTKSVISGSLFFWLPSCWVFVGWVSFLFQCHSFCEVTFFTQLSSLGSGDHFLLMLFQTYSGDASSCNGV